MERMGFLISRKNNEKRRALLPKDLPKIDHINQLYFEKGYGESIGISDDEYIEKGASILSRKEILDCEILVDVKLGDGDYIENLSPGKLLVGWAHAVQGLDFTTSALAGKHTVLAWEEIFEGGRYLFYRNREIAGEAAIIQSFRYCGKMPYDTKVAIIGNGQTARGALRVLYGLGATVDVYNRSLESLFKQKMFEYDVIVNCVLWDTNRTDRLIYREDLKKFRPGTMIIDISCNHGLEIETTHPTTIDDPVYIVDGVIHYAVDNTPAMFPLTVTNHLSEKFSNFVDKIINNDFSKELQKAIVISDGAIIDPNIVAYRKRFGL